MLITADLTRAALVASVPVAWWAGWLSMPQLYLVVLLTGVGTVSPTSPHRATCRNWSAGIAWSRRTL